MTAPAAPLALAFIAGVALHVPLGGALALSLAATLLVSALLASRGRAASAVATLLLVLAFALLGRSAAELAEPVPLLERVPLGRPVRIDGRLRLDPEPLGDTVRLTVALERALVGPRTVQASGGARVSVGGRWRTELLGLAAGDRLRLWTSLRVPTSFRNPGGVDSRRVLAGRNVHWLGSTKSARLVTRLERGRAWTGMMSRLRARCRERLARALGSDAEGRSTAGVALALLTGDRSGLSVERVRRYQRAGVFHVMAISGAHVGVWSAAIFGLLRIAGLSRRGGYLALLVFLPLYASFCGARAPVTRAALMTSLFVTGRLLGVRAPMANALSLSALLWLSANPASLSEAGFQMSFAAMAALAWLTPALDARGPLRSALSVSLAAQLGTLPIAAWHFHRLAPWTPLASLVAMPLAGIVCVLSAATVVVCDLPLVSRLVGAALTGAVALLDTSVIAASALPAASVPVPAPTPGWLVVYPLGLALLRARGGRARVAGVTTLALLVALLLVPRGGPPGTLEMTALDVGHGDAIVVSLPDGGVVLVDGGGLARSRFDTGERIVLPFLLDSGHRRVDAVVVSHEDYDHVGGLPAVLESLRTDALWVGRPDAERPAYRRLLAVAESRAVELRRLRSGQRLEVGGAVVDVLAAGESRGRSANDRSVVLKVSYAGRSILLTGDAESELEQELVLAGASLRADVLKVAHHGSRTSTTASFLAEVDPSVAVVSTRERAGRRLPSREVLDRLDRSRAVTLRTDRRGAVTLSIRADGSLWSRSVAEPEPVRLLPPTRAAPRD